MESIVNETRLTQNNDYVLSKYPILSVKKYKSIELYAVKVTPNNGELKCNFNGQIFCKIKKKTESEAKHSARN